MSLFKKAAMQTAYLKMGLYGEAGTGKSYTASLIAVGLAQHLEKQGLGKPPVMFFDTETGANWVKPLFDEAGIEFLVASTRAFDDLKLAVKEAEETQAILIADSMSHVWEEVREAYLAAKRKRFRNPHARLELPDWNSIKPEWGKFTSLYLNSSCHIILCGRAGNSYEFQEREEDGKKEMISSGTRMAAEKGLGYEPNLLVEMTSHQVTGAGRKKVIVRRATVLKDRSTTLDARQFENPTFKDFFPHIKKLNLGGQHTGFDSSRTSERLFPREERDDRRHDRGVLLDDLGILLDKHDLSGTSKESKLRRIALMEKHFGTAAKTAIENTIPTDDLRRSYDALHRELEGVASRYFPDAPEDINDEIPKFGGAPSGLQMLLIKYAEAEDVPALNEVQANAQAYLNDLSEGDREKASAAYSEAVKRVIKKMSAAKAAQPYESTLPDAVDQFNGEVVASTQESAI